MRNKLLLSKILLSAVLYLSDHNNVYVDLIIFRLKKVNIIN